MKIPVKTDIIYKGDDRIEAYKSDSIMSGNPDAVVRPRDWQEVKEILKWCNAEKIPVTVCGARTSMSGSSVAEIGVLVTTDHFNKIIDIGTENDRGYALLEPGLIVGEFQKAVEAAGYHYPVAPTSCNEAFIGGTVATNATGEDFYKYGPTRNFVREVTIIKIDGSEETLTRRSNPPAPTKGRGGYLLGVSPLDAVIGSEGTLAIIKQIKLDLLTTIPKQYIILIPFETNMKALEFIDEINNEEKKPRSLEFIDSGSLEIMQTHPTFPKLSQNVKALVYLKDEGEPDKWFDKLTNLSDETIVAITEKQKSDLHDWRHHIPATISEMHKELGKNGGAKVAGDWWVPKKHMLQMMKRFYDDSKDFGIHYLAYGHLGDGHPHADYICKNADEKKRADEMLKSHCKAAVSFGGGVAAEHGIGKIKRDLLNIQYSSDVIEQMKKIKLSYDPNWILGVGNIFQTKA